MKAPLSIAERLRREFDHSFELPAQTLNDFEDLLLIRVHDQKYALRVRDIVAFARLERMTEVPSQHPALAGMISVRGELLMVFDLAVLLGLPPLKHDIKWTVTLHAEPCSVAIGFAEVAGYVRIAATTLESSSKELVAGTARVQESLVGLLDSTALTTRICT